MAKNWSVKEAIKAFENSDIEGIKDINRRFPLFGYFYFSNPMKIIESFGEKVSARVVNKNLETMLGASSKIKSEFEQEVENPKKKNKKKGVRVSNKKIADVNEQEEFLDVEVKQEEGSEDSLDFDVDDLVEK